jgi:shikimate kinase
VLHSNLQEYSREEEVRVVESTDWNKQRVAATGQGITRMLACRKEILKEKKRSEWLRALIGTSSE